MMPGVSAGSNQVGASDTCTPQVSCPPGLPAQAALRPKPAKPSPESANTVRRVSFEGVAPRWLSSMPCSDKSMKVFLPPIVASHSPYGVPAPARPGACARRQSGGAEDCRSTTELARNHCCLPVGVVRFGADRGPRRDLAGDVKHKPKSGQRNSARRARQKRQKRRAPCGALQYRCSRVLSIWITASAGAHRRSHTLALDEAAVATKPVVPNRSNRTVSQVSSVKPNAQAKRSCSGSCRAPAKVHSRKLS